MLPFESFTLANGLRIIVHKDKSTPMVAMNIIYKVGSRDESPDRTGFAHLFEHLMFGGSVNIPKYDEPLQKAGGENNAFTNNDYTNYYLTIPKNNIETAFWLESDRMLSLAFSEKSLDVQRQVVIEEFKQNYLNQPYGDVYLLLKPMAYQKHPYQWNTIGKDISHIEQAGMQDVKSFYHKYYNPDNAILSVAGDISTGEISRLAEKWFGPIPSGKAFTRNYPTEPRQTELRELTVNRNVPQNAIYMAWHMPKRAESGFYKTDLISDVLSNGNSSRMYQNLIKKSKMFSEISAFVTGDLDQGLFIVSGRLLNGASREDAGKLIFDEMNRICNDLVEVDELKKVNNKIEANLLFSRMSVLSKAMNLAYYEMLGSASMINDEVENYQQVSRKDIKQKANEIFVETKPSILYYQAVNGNG
ncbi:MAG: pitrilysin family protein [Bacteroidales bacterium]|jgi:predicted Zn-dependent peptidase|nr:pitrilysin family protein [Bacteroidales bacterium]